MSVLFKKIIIFRFYKHPYVCLNRLKILRHFNPQIPIYGIFGGEESEISEYEKLLKKHLVNMYVIRHKTSEWKWRHFDLVLRDWYLEIGENVDFDMAYTVEWDLLLLDSVDNLYSHISLGEVGTTSIIPIKEIEAKWYWTSVAEPRLEWLQLVDWVSSKYNYTDEFLASKGPTLCFPKSFIDSYSKMEKVSELCHDEIRFPLFAQILDYKVKDTGFSKLWFDDFENQYFNCVDISICTETIKKELIKNGRKVFHPYKKIFEW